MDSSTGKIQIVLNQSMGPYAGCVVDAASFENRPTLSPGAIVTIVSFRQACNQSKSV
jgi:hypothetical protein